MLLKKKFTIEEVINNYYANVDAFGYDVFWLLSYVLIAQNIKALTYR
jgi:hypothetical protein